MSNEKYVVNLRDDERTLLNDLIKKGKGSARRITRAHILLLANEDKTDETIATTLHASISTIERTRKKFVEGNVEWALSDKPHPKRGSKLNAKGRALSQADLIRNYFFMKIHVNEQERLYEECWTPMQDRLGDNLTECIRHFLMKDGGGDQTGRSVFRAEGARRREVSAANRGIPARDHAFR